MTVTSRRLALVLGISGMVAVLLTGASMWLLRGDGIRIALERQATGWLGEPVRITAARAQLFPRFGVRLRDVQIGQPARVSLAMVELSTGWRALLSRTVEEADVVVADSRIKLPLPFSLPGAGSAAPGGGGKDFRITSIRRIALQRVHILSRGRELEISADSSLSRGRLTISNLLARAERTTVRGSGVVNLGTSLDADLKLDADRLDLDDLVALASAFSPSSDQPAPTEVPSGRVIARITARSVTAGALSVPQFSTAARVEGGRVSLSPTRFLLFGGRYEGDLDVDLRQARSMTLTARISDVDVAQLAAFGGSPDTVTGKLSGSGTFTGQGSDLATVLATAHGTGTATIVNGSIRNLSLVRTVVLFFGRPAPGAGAGSDVFERLDARFSLRDQRLSADALSVRSPDADIVGSGTLSLTSKVLDGHADLSLSEALSAQAGTDLYRYTREGNRIILPATIAGTLSAPRLSIDAGAALERGLRNEVGRRLRGLVDQLRPR